MTEQERKILKEISHTLDSIQRQALEMESENASLTVENEVLKRDVQNLQRTLEEANDELKKIQHDYNMELQEHSEYIKGINERVLIGHEEVRKEAFEEVFNYMYKLVLSAEEGCEITVTSSDIKEIALKKYGVRVKE